MAQGGAAAALEPLQMLFEAGAAGGLTDGQLLERFVRGRDETAFAVLVERHGPMVLRVCRTRLGDRHDAEDAFQATFLVLARKAPSIRESEAVAGWLLGVAGRVAAKARSAALRRSSAERKAGEVARAAADASPPEPWRELYDELERLPEKYRAPLVLFYLEGLTYEQAALRLGCPVRTVQTRLARGRQRLRGRLERRGLAPSAATLWGAGAPETAAIRVPVGLKQATVQAARRLANLKGAAAGASAATVALAREVCRAMLVAKINLIAGITVAAAVIGVGAWLAWPKMGTMPPAPRAEGGDLAAEHRAGSALDPAGGEKPDEPYYVTGFVKDEKTGQPVAGAKVQTAVGISNLEPVNREAITDADGRYSIDLPEGSAMAFTFTLPPGYWLPPPTRVYEYFAVTPAHPVYRKDYPVRRGTVWRFQLARGPAHEPVRGGTAFGPNTSARPSDEHGVLDVTLPSEAGETNLWLLTEHKDETRLQLAVRRDGGFRPEAVQNVKCVLDPGKPARFELVDAGGQTATITGPVEAAARSGRLVILATFPEAGSRPTGTLTGTVVDGGGHPIGGASVTIFYYFRQGGTISDRPIHHVQTDGQGRYAIPSIPRETHEGDLTKVSVVAFKPGYAGVDTQPFFFRRGGNGTQVVEPIRLQPGISVSGTVVDPDGRPAAGAEIRCNASWGSGAWTYRSGADGRFTIPDVSKGVLPLAVNFGKLTADGKYVADGKGELELKLRPGWDASTSAATAKPKPIIALDTGQPAPEWQVGGWSDGRTRSLAEARGKVVFLDFWGIWCGPCVHSLPVLEKLRAKYEPSGVVFASIHTPGDTLANIRRLFDLEHYALVSSIDEGPDDDIGNGTTARAYGVRGFPTHFVIDRSGKIAFRSDDPANQPARKALVKSLGLDSTRMTREQGSQLMEAFLGEAIEKALGAR
jgi:RNA polymerase sigma factor (sigma-70 family)